MRTHVCPAIMNIQRFFYIMCISCVFLLGMRIGLDLIISAMGKLYCRASGACTLEHNVGLVPSWNSYLNIGLAGTRCTRFHVMPPAVAYCGGSPWWCNMEK